MTPATLTKPKKTKRRGQKYADTHLPRAAPVTTEADLPDDDTHTRVVGSDTPQSEGGGVQKLPDAQSGGDAIASLRELQSHRIQTVRMQRSINNNTRALVRRFLGFQTGNDEADRKKACDEAAKMVKSIEAGQSGVDYQDRYARPIDTFVINAAAARAHFDAYRKNIEKEMERLAKSLPVWSWIEGVRGVSAMSLAIIVGEAGDLSNYANPGKLWKRFGLAPHQGKAASRWRVEGGLSADDWTDLGYSPIRRSAIFTIGDSMLKSQINVVKDADGNKTDAREAAGEYGAIYLDRKRYELDRDPEMKPIAAHRRAQRYMEKRLIRDLWKQWRAHDK